MYIYASTVVGALLMGMVSTSLLGASSTSSSSFINQGYRNFLMVALYFCVNAVGLSFLTVAYLQVMEKYLLDKVFF